MAFGKPAIIKLARTSPLLLRWPIMSLSRLSSQGIGPPPEITWFTPSCRIRRAAAAASSFEPGVLSRDPPSAASRQIFGVSFPSKRGPPRAVALEVADNDKADAPQVAGIARAATPAVLRIVLLDGLFMPYYTRTPTTCQVEIDNLLCE